MKRWTSSEEEALQQISEKCAKYRDQHATLAKAKNRWRVLLAVLIVVFSTASGIVNFVTDSDGTSPHSGVRYGIGAVNCITAGVTWLSSKLNMGKRVEAHQLSAKSYAGLIRNIEMEVGIARRDRTVSGAGFLHICMEHMNKILEESPDLPDDTIVAKMQLTD